MPGPVPNPNRIRRNKPELVWIDLPAEGRVADPPEPPRPIGDALAAEWWDAMWRTPSATQWGEPERWIAYRHAVLMGDLAGSDRKAAVSSEMRQLESALGLTAKARKELRWRIVHAGQVVEQNGEASDGFADPLERVVALRIVDDQAS